MIFSQMIDQMRQNIHSEIEYNYDDHLFKSLIRAYSRLTDFPIPSYPLKTEERQKLCGNMYKWYQNTYSVNQSDKTAKKRGRCANNTSKLKEDIKSEDNTKLLRDYAFSNLDKKTFKEIIENPCKRPSLTYLLKIAVGFKYTENECNELLHKYGYMKLHSRNPFHVAIYIILKEMEKQTEIERKSQFDQFDLLQSLFFDALNLIENNTPIAEELLQNENSINLNSTTNIYNAVMPQLNRDIYARYIAKYKNSFNEYHQKLLNEYLRIVNILLPLFFDGETTKTDGKNTWAEYSADGCNDQMSRYYFFSLYQFIESYCSKSITAHNFKSELYGIYKKERVCQTTREMMIIMWILESCYINARPIPCSTALADNYIGKYIKQVTDGKFKSVTNNNFTDILMTLYPTEEDGLFDNVNSQTEALQLLGIYPNETSNEKKYLNISQMLGYQTVELHNRNEIDPLRLWKGSDIKTHINNKLQNYGMLPLAPYTQFDRTILELCEVSWQRDTANQGYIYCYKDNRLTDMRPNHAPFFRKGNSQNVNQPQSLDMLPEKLKLLFKILDHLGDSQSFPLECKLHEIF